MKTVVTAALLLDAAWGELPTTLHPVGWMGRGIAAARRHRAVCSPVPSLLEGALVTAGGAGLAGLAAGVADMLLRGLPRPARAVANGAALKPALALHALMVAGEEVERALRGGDLVEARRLLGRHLVSRDTTGLGEAEVAGAAIESLAENLGDGLVGPLLAFRLGGLPAAYAYRWVNTCDSILGYRTTELEWYGKAAARADDVLNLLPSRLTALLIAMAAPLAGGTPTAALRCAARDAWRTASPNAGWPMAAMAGALSVRLTKRGEYELNPGAREPGPDDLARAAVILAGAGALAALLAEAL